MARRRKITNYSCFRCGEPNDIFDDSEELFSECNACGERAVVSYQSALDILNDLYLKDVWKPIHEEEEETEEKYRELNFDENSSV